MLTIADFQTKYDSIMQEYSDPTRTTLLSELMTIMETAFDIPMLQNITWESEHAEVISLYRKVSASRSL